MIPGITLLIIAVLPVEDAEIIGEFRPHEGKGLVILMKGSVKGRQRIVVADDVVFTGHFEFDLFVQAFCDEPQVNGEKTVFFYKKCLLFSLTYINMMK